MRPRRLYVTKDNRFYYLINGKKKFIKVPEGMSQKQLQKVNITNIIGGPAKRLKKRTKKVVPVYDKKIAKNEDMQKISTLPTYIFTPKKKIPSLGDSTDQTIIDLLKKVTKIELPEIEKKESKSTQIEPKIKIESGVQTEPEIEKKPKSTQTEPKIKIESGVQTEPEIKIESVVQTEPKIEIEPKELITYDRLLPFIEETLNKFRDKSGNIKNGNYTNLELELIAKEIDVVLPSGRLKKADLISAIDKYLTQIGAGKEKNDDGLYNDQIEKIMKKRIKNYVPVVASDKVDDLLKHVTPKDKFFSAVINTDPSGSSGRHWRCIVIDNRDDFPSAEYFDPLAEDFKPEETLLAVMRKIAKKMNPEKYFKYKFSLIRRQDISKSNCGYHCMKFIEDRHNGIPYSEASGWDDYMKMRQKGKGYDAPNASQDGENDLKSYEKMIKKKFNSYI